ncbi:Cloroperoxidase [Sistotremastrum suecicum HHB10207 ss-3]|uniref:Cloroperoxidase n=1 Tax=Sistotremastrum suecicum HHB10207 ss-3 TaxID=1314776 RepID=A0A165ZVP7_9AGAM|nr:Cloroperoxidase [Sistotremastrum suecicum HHB10207 ss-3]
MSTSPSKFDDLATTSAFKPWTPPGPDDSRGPCPGLNTLANHGYLPHDGKNISFSQLYKALREVYNISIPWAFILASGTVLQMGEFSLSSPHLPLPSLHKLALHNKIEHDSSLVHANAPSKDAKWAPAHIDDELLKRLLDQAEAAAADHGGLTPEDFGEIRALRDRTALSNGPLTTVQARLAWSESTFLMMVLGGVDEKIKPEYLKAFIGEERLPIEEGWVRPAKKIGLGIFNDMVVRIKKAQISWEKANPSEKV